MFDGRASLPNEVKDDIAQFLESAQGTDCPWSQAQILPIHIRRNIKLAEAPSYGKTIFEYEENCHGAEDYRKVAEFIHAQFHPPKAPDILQPVAVNEIKEQPPSPSAPSPQPDSQTQQQQDTQPVEADEKQNQPPIEIKAISPDQQQQEGDLEEQPSEFTQTTSENPNI